MTEAKSSKRARSSTPAEDGRSQEPGCVEDSGATGGCVGPQPPSKPYAYVRPVKSDPPAYPESTRPTSRVQGQHRARSQRPERGRHRNPRPEVRTLYLLDRDLLVELDSPGHTGANGPVETEAMSWATIPPMSLREEAGHGAGNQVTHPRPPQQLHRALFPETFWRMAQMSWYWTPLWFPVLSTFYSYVQLQPALANSSQFFSYMNAYMPLYEWAPGAQEPGRAMIPPGCQQDLR